MKYTDEELAEAAVLLAHVEDGPPLSQALQRKLLAEGGRVAEEARYTTTKGAVMELGTARGTLTAVAESPKRTWGAWLGWCAAAAVSALSIYQWRAHQPAAPAATQPLGIQELRGEEGSVVATATPGTDRHSIDLHVLRLPASTTERYQVWVSAGGRESAEPVGFFLCPDACNDLHWRLPVELDRKSVRSMWLTRGPDEAKTLSPALLVVGQSN